MQDITITLVHTELAWEDIPANLALFDSWFEKVPDETDLVVLPEMFTTGFSMNASAIAQEMDGSAVQWMREASRRNQTDIVGSMNIQAGGKYLNRLIWVRPDGELYCYDKRHLFRMAGEDKVFHAGEKLLTVTLGGWKSGRLSATIFASRSGRGISTMPMMRPFLSPTGLKRDPPTGDSC